MTKSKALVLKSLFAAGLSLIVFSFTGCEILFDLLEESSGSSDYSTVHATENANWDYSSSMPAEYVGPEVKTLVISNVPEGKNLYVVPVNMGDTVVKARDVRGVVVDSGINRAAMDLNPVEIPAIPEEEGFVRKHFKADPLPEFKPSAARSAAVTEPVYSTAAGSKEWKKGDQKDIFVDVNSGMNSYEKKPATLRAVGKNCYVWIVNDYYSKVSDGTKVNEEVAQKFADSFDAIYPYITNVFGDESNEIINYNTQRFEDMTSVSDTGTMVNIVIYDIGISDNGILGYFYSKDYTYGPGRLDIVSKSNAGKYFYIDSKYANTNFNLTLSTLAHEFQHMINWNQKNMNKAGSPSTWYNEMLSMLCEDMMQSYLGLSDKDSPKSRTQGFNGTYWLSGTFEYLEKNSAISYGNAFTFGSWLARQYGGAEFVREMSVNSYVDEESVLNAVKKFSSTSYSMPELYKQYLLAITGTSAADAASYTHNKNAAQTLSYETYKYPMTAYNIWHRDYSPALIKVSNTQTFKEYFASSVYSEYDFKGPLILDYNRYSMDLRPGFGFQIHGIKKTTAGQMVLNFTEYGADCVNLCIIIQ